MPMSPRLLRPRATGFNPRSISGLALWLDAADSASLYTTDAGPVTAVTDPRDIAGCVLWLDGADASTVTASGGSVSEWRDKTSGARHFTASSTAQPTYTATLNGRNVLTFNGSTNTMTGNAAAQDAIRNRAGYTFFAVSKVGSVAAGERLLCGFGTTVIFRAGQNGSSPYAGGRRVSGDTLENITGAASSLAVGSSYITSAIVNHTAQSLTGNLNGSGFASDTTYMAAGSSENTAMTASLGSQNSAYGFYNGDIAEVIIFDTALSTTDRARVESYLAAKWGISGVHAPATATNDPVGAWLDKSGNGRHVTQATAAARPLRTTVASRSAVGFDGTDDTLGTGNVPTGNDITTFCVYRPSVLNGGVAFDYAVTGSAADNQNITGFGNTIGLQVNTSGAALHRLDSTRSFTQDSAGRSSENGAVSAGAVAISTCACSFGASTTRHAALNGASMSATTRFNGGIWQALTISGRRSGATNTAASPFWNGQVCEFLMYEQNLSQSIRRTVERYLASKWNITLAPQVSNAEAQDWINRVYANGGTVSATTAAAVNAFCNSIDAVSGLRACFFRLNLFCGDSDSTLAAVRTPLYRGQSLTGTQFGNTTDTNNNFVAGDYNEASGLKGNLSTKHLATGLLPGDMGGPLHLAASVSSDWGNNEQLLGCDNAFDAGFQQVTLDTTTVSSAIRSRFILASSQSPRDEANSIATTAAYRIVGSSARTSGATSRLYRNGTSVATAGGTFNTFPAFAMFVFGSSRKGALTNPTNARMSSYSMGLNMTDSQVAAYNTALVAFLQALGRPTA